MKNTDDIGNILIWLRDYANYRINSRLIDERRSFPPYIILDFGNQGLLGMLAPKLYGGMELSSSSLVRVLEQLGSIDLSLGLFVGLNNVLGIMPITKYANKTVQEELLPLLAKGRELAAFSITEPGAGSNPLAISSKAVFDSLNTWRLFGKKIWSGSAAWAGVINIFVKLCDENGRDKGITGFVVKQRTKGLRQGEEQLTMGMRGMVQNTIYLEGAIVTKDYQLGLEGHGMQVAQDAMMLGRLGISALSLGGMKRCLQLILRYSEKRIISSGKLLDNKVTLMYISDIVYAIIALENIIEVIVNRIDNNEFIPNELFAICKIFGSEFLWGASDKLVQLLGGRGYIETNIAPQMLRDARVFRIFEGPTETLYCFIGAKLLNNPEEIYTFLVKVLNEPQSVERIKGILQKIQDGSKNYQYNSFIIGKIISYLIPMFILQHKYKDANNEAINKTIKWLECWVNQFIFKYVTKEDKQDLILNAGIIKDLVFLQQDSIGDIEQTMVGENFNIDPMISKMCQQYD